MFGVPVVFASGDDAAMQELKSRLPGLETVETKHTLGFHSALTLTPQAACDRITAGVGRALARAKTVKRFILTTPVTLELSFKNYTAAEMLSYLSAVQRVDSHTIRFIGKDMAEVEDFVEFVDNYKPDMAP